MQKAMDFLTKKRKGDSPPVIVVCGDDEFLARSCRLAVRDWVIGPEPDDFVYSVFEAANTPLANVLDDLQTPPFIGDRKLVVVAEADKFVTQHRGSLERYVAQPSSIGVLMLVVDSWTATTKLAKAVEERGLAIDAKPIQAWTTAAWCVQWAKHAHDKKISKPTAEWLVELVGTHLGLLDQELAKLSVAMGDAPEIDLATVTRLSAGQRLESAFKLLDAVFEGNMHEALRNLDRQIVSGESPVGILAMMTSQLRKLTHAARLAVAGRQLADAVQEAGLPRFAVEKSMATLRKFGRPGMAGMYRRLLAADLDLKGGIELNQRTVLERFLLDLARLSANARPN